MLILDSNCPALSSLWLRWFSCISTHNSAPHCGFCSIYLFVCLVCLRGIILGGGGCINKSTIHTHRLAQREFQFPLVRVVNNILLCTGVLSKVGSFIWFSVRRHRKNIGLWFWRTQAVFSSLKNTLSHYYLIILKCHYFKLITWYRPH